MCSLAKLSMYDKIGKHVLLLDRTYWRVGIDGKNCLLVRPERIPIVWVFLNHHK